MAKRGNLVTPLKSATQKYKRPLNKNLVHETQRKNGSEFLTPYLKFCSPFLKSFPKSTAVLKIISPWRDCYEEIQSIGDGQISHIFPDDADISRGKQIFSQQFSILFVFTRFIVSRLRQYQFRCSKHLTMSTFYSVENAD